MPACSPMIKQPVRRRPIRVERMPAWPDGRKYRTVATLLYFQPAPKVEWQKVQNCRNRFVFSARIGLQMARNTELSERFCVSRQCPGGMAPGVVGGTFVTASRTGVRRDDVGGARVERAGWCGEKAALGAPCRIRTVRAPGKRASGAFSARTARVERARTSHSRGSWGRAAERVAGADRSERPENAPVARFQRGQRALSAQVGWGKKKESCTWCAL